MKAQASAPPPSARPERRVERGRRQLVPRVAPWFTITTGIPSDAACRTYRNPDMTVNDDPSTTSADDADTSEKHASTRGFGTFSPKNTTSGLSTPPHDRQSTTVNPAVSSSATSPSGLTAPAKAGRGPRRVGRPQPLVERRAATSLPARQAHHPVQRRRAARSRTGAGRLVQPVHVLRDDPAKKPVPLERRHRAVPGVRRRPGHVPPAQVRPRPVPLPRRRATR